MRIFMKKILTLITLTLAMSLFMTSCGDDDDTTGPSSLKIGEMTATVGGSSWEAQNAIYYNTPRQVSGAQVDVSDPINGTTKTISVILATTDQQPQTKTYTAICFYQETTGIGTTSETKSWNDGSGSCEVTEVTDTEIKGTFTFTGTNDDDATTKQVTGSFFVSRQ